MFCNSPLDLGEEFFLWEFATPIAGALIGINPFDQPNVQESKDNTKRILKEYEQTAKFLALPRLASGGGLSVLTDENNQEGARWRLYSGSSDHRAAGTSQAGRLLRDHAVHRRDAGDRSP